VWVVYSDPCFPDAKNVPPAVVVQHFVSLFPQKYPVPRICHDCTAGVR
jgi:hypothetical protein